MASRLQLHEMLCRILGSRHAYFQSPGSTKMNYPAIVYGLDGIKNSFANGGVYSSQKRYAVTLIDRDPDSALIDKLSALPLCKFNRQYTKDGLNHTVFNLYF